MYSYVVCVFVLLSFDVLVVTRGREVLEDAKKSTDEANAAEWLRQMDKMMEESYYDLKSASWNYNVNLTEYNNLKQIEASLRSSKFLKEAYKNASRYDWKNFKDPELVRQFSKVTDIGVSVLPDEDLKTFESLQNQMQFIYSVGEVCDKPVSDGQSNRTCFPQNPDLNRVMGRSRDWEELLWAWKGWRDVTGKKVKELYAEHVRLVNKAAVMNGYKDHGDYWRSFYEMHDLKEVTDQLLGQVIPLYRQLHAYVRRKLMDNYSRNEKDFPRTRHIPAHLTGNIWAQTWGNIFDIVTPFRHSPVLDITDILKDRGFNAHRMFEQADAFFVSLGLHPMPKEFWKESLIEKPKDGRNVVCHASAWDFFNKRDFRIKQCTDITGEYFFTTHHEMGHIQYHLNYKHLPVIYRYGANPGFHEAVGDVISLSVMTPEHLQRIGLLNKTTNSPEADLNFLMKQALNKVAFLPYAYLLDNWRWQVFEGKITAENYNWNYWKIRCRLQGVSPPVPRSEQDFDPGAKFHVINNTPYIRYFVSYIIQFQFHKALCDAAGHRGPLHKCDIYNSATAGDKLRRMLELGSSKPWPEVMEVLTGQRQMDARPFLDYFRPLHDWLEEQNRGQNVTWDEDCPPEAFVSASATLHRKSSLLVLTLVSLLFSLPPF